MLSRFRQIEFNLIFDDLRLELPSRVAVVQRNHRSNTSKRLTQVESAFKNMPLPQAHQHCFGEKAPFNPFDEDPDSGVV
jgi:hypothetical protein